ncbi:hypothetical protein Q7P35_007242 [Cladosporium inversicolor]
MEFARTEHLHQKHRTAGESVPVQEENARGRHYATLEFTRGDVLKTPNVPQLIDDNISAIGRLYLAESASVHHLDSRGDAHHLWGLALWDLAMADATLFECVALLTLQKKRSIATAYNKVVYLDHKQKVYQGLSEALMADRANVSGATALTMTLLSFVEVLEGNFDTARSHIDAVAAMNFIPNLNEVQWRLIIWNDLRFAMKLVALPTLCYCIPIFSRSALAQIDGAVLAEARRLAFGNLKHLRKLPELDEDAWFPLLVSIHIVDIICSRRAHMSHQTRLVCAYEAEYRVHTTAANLSKEPRPDSTTTLMIIACQLHILAVTSGFAPSTVECRETLLSRARSLIDSSDRDENMFLPQTCGVPMLWALTTLCAHIIDGGFEGRRQFVEKLAATVKMKRLQSRATFVRLLRPWPWVDTWHQSRVSTVWEEVLIARGRRWRCIATQDNPDNCTETQSKKFYAGILLFYAS